MRMVHESGAYKMAAYLSAHPDDECAAGCQIICTRCKDPKPTNEFYLPRARRYKAEGKPFGGKTSGCRACASLTATVYRAPRVALIDAARASGCVDCGIVSAAHPEIFDFDHVREGKAKPVSAYLTSGTLEQLADEIARCEVVCSNCHRIRTRGRVSGKKGRNYS